MGYIKNLFAREAAKSKDKIQVKPEQKIEFVPRTEFLTSQGSYLETLTKQERDTLKNAMITARNNYEIAIQLIARGNTKNPEYLVKQQGMLEEILFSYVRGVGLGVLADDQQVSPDKLREFLKPLGFTEEEFPLYDRPDVD